MGNPDPINAWQPARGGRSWRDSASATMWDMTEPAIATPDLKPLLDRAAVLQALIDQKHWATDTAGAIAMATNSVMELARPVPTREEIMSAMITAIYEDPEPLVRQGMPQQEWELLSIAADAVVALLSGSAGG